MRIALQVVMQNGRDLYNRAVRFIMFLSSDLSRNTDPIWAVTFP